MATKRRRRGNLIRKRELFLTETAKHWLMHGKLLERDHHPNTCPEPGECAECRDECGVYFGMDGSKRIRELWDVHGEALLAEFRKEHGPDAIPYVLNAEHYMWDWRLKAMRNDEAK